MESNENMTKKEAKIFSYIENTYSGLADFLEIREDFNELKVNEFQEELKNVKQDLMGETIVAFIGEFSSGKSTFMNAIFGNDIIPTADHPCTSVINEIEFVNDGLGHRGEIHYLSGEKMEEISYPEIKRILDGKTGAIGQMAAIHHILLKYDIFTNNEEISPLKIFFNAKIKFIDTPGFNSPYGLNTTVLMEYIAKSKYTFWFFPADKIGGTFATKFLREIKRKGIEIVPIITKSDLIENEESKDEIIEKFENEYSDLIGLKELRFISSYNLFDALKLLNKNEKTKTREDIGKINKLIQSSGIEALNIDMQNIGTNKNVITKKIDQSKSNLLILLQKIQKLYNNEERYWYSELNRIGWQESDKYQKLNEIRVSLDKYSKKKASEISNDFENTISEKILNSITRKTSAFEINKKITNTINEYKQHTLQEKMRKISEYIEKKYEANYELSIISNLKIEQPKTFDLNEIILTPIWAVFDSLKYMGPQASITGILGAGLLASTSAIGSIPFVGTTLGVIATFGGGIILIIAIIPIIPMIFDRNKIRREEAKLKLRNSIKDWCRTIKIENEIYRIIKLAIDEIDNKLRIEADRNIAPNFRNLQQVKDLIKNNNELIKEIQVLF